jgi:hypothetical protein
MIRDTTCLHTNSDVLLCSTLNLTEISRLTTKSTEVDACAVPGQGGPMKCSALTRA